MDNVTSGAAYHRPNQLHKAFNQSLYQLTFTFHLTSPSLSARKVSMHSMTCPVQQSLPAPPTHTS